MGSPRTPSQSRAGGEHPSRRHSPVSPEDYLAKGRRALASARLLLVADDVEGVCNRVYYAMFDAAHGALVKVQAGMNPAQTRTHQGLIAAFGLHLVKTGRMAAELGRSLNQVERVRLLADYTGEATDRARAQWTVGQADAFVAAVEHWMADAGQGE